MCDQVVDNETYQVATCINFRVSQPWHKFEISGGYVLRGVFFGVRVLEVTFTFQKVLPELKKIYRCKIDQSHCVESSNYI